MLFTPQKCLSACGANQHCSRNLKHISEKSIITAAEMFTFLGDVDVGDVLK